MNAETLTEQQASTGMRQRAGQVGRLLWGLLVGIATLGGVLGVIQFFDRDGADLPPEALVLRMVDEGDLSAEQAESLIVLLGEGATSETVAALTSGSDRQVEALRLVAATPTFERGISILEEEAESASDWQLIAELSSGRDNERALSAARQALALAPQDFDILRLLIERQLAAGDFSDARRAHASLSAIARTPMETLKAAIVQSRIAIATLSPDDIETAAESLDGALARLEPLENLPAPGAGGEFLKEPKAVAAQGLAARGSLNFRLKNWDAVEPDFLRAIAITEAMTPDLAGRALRRARMRLATYHDSRASVMHQQGELADHHEAHEKAISQFRAMAEDGVVEAQEHLPMRLVRLGSEYWDMEEPDLARARGEEAKTRFDEYAKGFPADATGLSAQRNYIEAWNHVFDGNPAGAQTVLEQQMAELEKDLLREGDPERLEEVLQQVNAGVTLLYRSKSRDAALLTSLHAPAMRVVSAFERRYGRSEATSLQRLNLRALHVYAMSIAESGADIEEREAMLRELVSEAEDLMETGVSEASRQTLDRLALFSMSALSGMDVEDAEDIARNGLELARMRDAQGQLSTAEQPYIAAFEARLEALQSNADGEDE